MDIRELFKKKNIKTTRARILIYGTLLNNEEAINAENIYRFIKDQEDVNLSTVYRTLELFENKELIDKLYLGEGKAAYKIKKNLHNHKLECSLCHKEVEIPCPMNQIEEILKEKTGFRLTEHQLKLKGICENCLDE